MSYKGPGESIPLQSRAMPGVTVAAHDGSTRSIFDQEEGRTNNPYSQSARAAGHYKQDFSDRKGAYAAVTEADDEDEEEQETHQSAAFFQRLIKFSAVTRFALYIIPVALVLVIPIVLTATVFKKKAHIGDISEVGLFIWIELVWLSAWVALLLAKLLPYVFQFFGGFISSGSRKYAQLLKAVMLPMAIFFWALIARSITPVICAFDMDEKREEKCDDEWIQTLRKALLATVAVTAIFFVEKLMIHLLSVSYRQKQFKAKLKEDKRITHILSLMFDHSRKLFPMYCPQFLEEDYKIAGAGNAPSGLRKGPDSISYGRVGSRLSAVMSSTAKRFTGKEILRPGSGRSVVLQALESPTASEALGRRLWLSFVRIGQADLYEEDIVKAFGQDGKDEAKEIFEALDKDCNGDVSLEEMLSLCSQIGQDKKHMERSMHDIGQVIKSLDNLFMILVFLLTILVYAAFFNSALASRATTLWGSFAALSFAIAGTVQEFLGSCVFIFIKHPYDVGDRVDINNVQLVVEHISLMYTIFRQVDTGALTQIPNIVNNGVWIKNTTRSRAMAERYDFSISAKTKFDAIENLKAELQAFIQNNKRDFQPDVDIELISVGNLKELVLRVEIRHKSNWANEALRATRRSKFLCALLTALRKHSINKPGGGGDPPIGSWENPGYSVTISDEEAASARVAYEAKEEAKRLKKLNADAAKSKETSTDPSAEAPAGASDPFTTQAELEMRGTRYPDQDPRRVSVEDEEFDLQGRLAGPQDEGWPGAPHRTASDASSRPLIQTQSSYPYPYQARPGYGPRDEKRLG